MAECQAFSLRKNLAFSRMVLKLDVGELDCSFRRNGRGPWAAGFGHYGVGGVAFLPARG